MQCAIGIAVVGRFQGSQALIVRLVSWTNMSAGKSCLLFMHGSGSCGQDITGYLDSITLADHGYNTFRDVAQSLSIDIIAPTSDARRYTPMGGERCNVWFDRTAFFIREGMADTEDFEGAERSINQILAKLQQIQHKYEHIFIGGFSMGGCLALHALRKSLPVNTRGIFSLGSFVVQSSAVVVGDLDRSASDIPLLMMHGERDAMISCEWGRQTASNLLLRDVDVQFRTYPGVGHEIDPAELSDLIRWVKDVLVVFRNSDAGKADSRAEGKEPERSSGGSKGIDEDRDRDMDRGDKAGPGRNGCVSRAAEAKATGGACSSNNGPFSAATEGMHLKYSLEYLSSTDGRSTGAATGTTLAVPLVRVKYAVPRDLINVMAARPVLACGSVFEVLPASTGEDAVQVTLQSSDPHKTAVQIGLRLQNRVSGNSANLNPCPIS